MMAIKFLYCLLDLINNTWDSTKHFAVQYFYIFFDKISYLSFCYYFFMNFVVLFFI